MDYQLTSLHETLKQARYLTTYKEFPNGVRYFFEHNEKKGVIQLPRTKNQELVTHFSSKETEDWFQVLVDLCKDKLEKSVVEKSTGTSNEHSTTQSLHMNVMLRGKVMSEHQRKLVKQLVESGFEIFEVKSNS